MPREVEGLENFKRILDRPVGSIVTEHSEKDRTETFFISMNELNKTQL